MLKELYLCPCGSSLLYRFCCKPLHAGQKAKTAEQLMRSRYCAYALGIGDYIIKTTHPRHREYAQDRKKWSESISLFCKGTLFHGLTIHESSENEKNAFVIFTAYLSQNGSDVTFTEKSLFEKIDGIWLYVEGVLQ